MWVVITITNQRQDDMVEAFTDSQIIDDAIKFPLMRRKGS